MLVLVIEFGHHRRKFHIVHPVNINLIESEIKLNFGIEQKHHHEYIIQIYDQEINDYLDLTLDLLNEIDKTVLKGHMVLRSQNSFDLNSKIIKEQSAGLGTLESVKDSLEKWSILIQTIQLEILKEIDIVEHAIRTAESSHRRVHEPNSQKDSCTYQLKNSSCSFSSISPVVNKKHSLALNLSSTNSQLTKAMVYSHNEAPLQLFGGNNSDEPQHRIDPTIYHQGGLSYKDMLTIPNSPLCCPPSHIMFKQIDSNIRVTVTYQRFQSGVKFQGELSKYYNPTYFFLRISNQLESYDEMHQQINLYYNNLDFSQNQIYFLQSGDFCVAKSLTDSNWYRARIVRPIQTDEFQLIFIDSGKMHEVNADSIRPLNHEFAVRPAQAIACSLSEIVPLTRNGECRWSRRACRRLENAMTNERVANGKYPLNVTITNHNQIVWPMMFVDVSTELIPNLSEYMCELYLCRRCSNVELSQFWSSKIRPEQYVLFNLSSSINQKQYFTVNNNPQSALTPDQIIDIIMNDLEFSQQ